MQFLAHSKHVINGYYCNSIISFTLPFPQNHSFISSVFHKYLLLPDYTTENTTKIDLFGPCPHRAYKIDLNVALSFVTVKIKNMIITSGLTN